LAGAASGDGRFQLDGIGADLSKDAEVSRVAAEVDPELVAQVVFELVALMKVVEVLDSLLEADSDEEADRDGRDVDEEVSPGVFGFVGSVDVEHGSLSG
jgi:hypothetical protein